MSHRTEGAEPAGMTKVPELSHERTWKRIICLFVGHDTSTFNFPETTEEFCERCEVRLVDVQGNRHSRNA